MEHWKDDLTRAYLDLTSMIASERDGRRASLSYVRADIKIIHERLDSIDKHLVADDERAAGFEAAMIESLGKVHSTVLNMIESQKSLEVRVSDLEQWRRDQAS
ncbi:MAG: hypothetical protein FJZ00_00720 [Candidatus Sericytochromatia bacterium]|uniref:Uncharacterized protein n=1 Tax=Candidatus Tanganyikabacteria bacterium TaxID=2961651 RepID=A0A937X3P4_9BACT|nr:hypothetical protein [Candidatus Tanganyikabacteria bacterium]